RAVEGFVGDIATQASGLRTGDISRGILGECGYRGDLNRTGWKDECPSASKCPLSCRRGIGALLFVLRVTYCDRVHDKHSNGKNRERYRAFHGYFSCRLIEAWYLYHPVAQPN